MLDRRRLAFIVFVSALAFHAIAYALNIVDRDYLGGGDGLSYEELARSILHGQYALDGAPYMGRTPGYPIFLAAVHGLFGTSFGSVQIVQSILDAIVCALIVDIAVLSRLRTPAVAAVAVSCATNLYVTALAFRGLAEALYTFCMVGALWLLVAFPGARPPFGARGWALLVSGVLIGVGVLARPVLAFALILFVALLVGRTFVRDRASLLRPAFALSLVLFGAGSVATVGPWVIRNQITFAEDYRHRDPDQLSLLGYRSPFLNQRFLYRKPYFKWVESYEEPLVIITPLDAPSWARWAYPGEETDVRNAHARMRETYERTGAFPDDVMAPFDAITKKRYAAAPWLYVTAPTSKFLKFWLTPRVAIAWAKSSGFSANRGVTAFYLLYNFGYVVVGLIGLIAARKKWVTGVGIFALAMLASHSVAYSLWHPFPQSRYAVPLMPFFALGIGGAVHVIAERLAARKGARPPAEQSPPDDGLPSRQASR